MARERPNRALAKVSFKGSYVFLKPEAKGAALVRQYLLPLLPPALLEDGKAKVTDWHCTVMFSDTDLGLDELLEKITTNQRFYARLFKLETFGKNNEVIVGLLDSPDIRAYHEQVSNLLAWDSEHEYVPHITLVTLPEAFPENLRGWLDVLNDDLATKPLDLYFGNPAVDYGKA